MEILAGAGIVKGLTRSATLSILSTGLLLLAPISAADSGEQGTEPPPSLAMALAPTEAEVALPPLGPKSLNRLDPAIRIPHSAGLSRRIAPGSMNEVGAASSPAWSQTSSGPVWRTTVKSPDAKALRLHFGSFSLGEGELWIHSGTTQAVGPYRGRGPFGDGEFWSPLLKGESAVVEYWPSASSLPEGMLPFEILEVGHLWLHPDWLEEVRPSQETIEHGPSGAEPRFAIAPEQWALANTDRFAENRQLISGQPRSFSMADPETSPASARNSSYLVDVKAGIQSVEFALSAVDEASAVALFLRHGDDIEVLRGEILADHIATSVDGRARLVLTRDSSPPLRTGTYYVSIGGSPSGQPSSGTITVTPRYTNHSCFHDAACRTEADATLARRASGVAMIAIVDDETKRHGYCSGAWIGSGGSSRTSPYFLTAAHCVENEAEARTVEAFWHYQNRNCSGKPSEDLDPRYTSTNGARLLAVETGSLVGDGGISSSGAGDMALLRLLESPPTSAFPLSWNAHRNAIRVGTNVLGIHHAESQTKQISYGEIDSSRQHMFFVEWANGLTLAGASGSPLLNESGQVLGVLSGGRDDHEGCFDQGSPTLYSSLASFYPKVHSYLDSSRPAPEEPVSDVVAGGPLQPGVPRPYRLGGGTARQLLNGSYSYVVDVPAGVAVLELNLASQDPSVDVDMYVRFQADNQISNYDWSATTPYGNEHLVIGRNSDPPLRPGRYYISLLLYDESSAAASGTLTARLVSGGSPPAASNEIEFVSIPPGTFMMGSLDGLADPDESPLTQVRITGAFEMGKYEVLQGQWAAVMGSNPSYDLSCGANCPVESVSWNDTLEFIEKLNQAGDGYLYRLPTEAEWEYTARAGTDGQRYGRIDQIGWYVGNSGDTIQPAGLKAANTFGLYDMIGNVYEWVQDWHGYYPGGSLVDPTGPPSGEYRVARGGSKHSSLREVRASYRAAGEPDDQYSDVGLRLVREPVGGGPAPPSGRTLEIGVPHPFALSAASARTIQNGSESYIVEVPEGARRLSIALESEDSRVDVDLYVRYEQDNESGRFDWNATTPSGNETLEITQQSTPQLLPGRYFVSLLLYDYSVTGARGTLTATISMPGDGPEGIEFVRVPAGQFVMGSNSVWSFSDERPLTPVRISRAFEIGKYEVTQEQWESVMGSNPSSDTSCGASCPVEAISWNDVQGFIERLNAALDGYTYSLPTEAEWEYAARAGATNDLYGPLGDIAWYVENSGLSSHPVGRKLPNGFGLYDMLGNVSEWVQDWYESYPGFSVTDPTGPASGAKRVTRGGSWNFDQTGTRVSARNFGGPDDRFTNVGFRVLRRAVSGGGDSGSRHLVSGVPVRFELDPATAGRIQNGLLSYVIDVPASATSLRLSLVSDNPGIDVDLFARYQADTEQTRYDWSSRTIFGNEEILITGTSTPSLRSGRYYVSLLLYEDSGAAARGTLTATVASTRAAQYWHSEDKLSIGK